MTHEEAQVIDINLFTPRFKIEGAIGGGTRGSGLMITCPIHP